VLAKVELRYICVLLLIMIKGIFET